MNSYDAFKNKMKAEQVAQERLSVKFIYEGINAVTITVNGVLTPAALVYKENDENPDGAEVFVETKNALNVGDTFT